MVELDPLPEEPAVEAEDPALDVEPAPEVDPDLDDEPDVVDDPDVGDPEVDVEPEADGEPAPWVAPPLDPEPLVSELVPAPISCPPQAIRPHSALARHTLDRMGIGRHRLLIAAVAGTARIGSETVRTVRT